MMYDGQDYQSKRSNKRGKTSSGARLQPYQKVETWEDNPFWENDSHTEKGKQIWRDFVKNMKTDEHYKRRRQATNQGIFK